MKCPYIKLCKYYSENNETCNKDLNDLERCYCGTYRDINDKESEHNHSQESMPKSSDTSSRTNRVDSEFSKRSEEIPFPGKNKLKR
jgi:hypothetical protein